MSTRIVFPSLVPGAAGCVPVSYLSVESLLDWVPASSSATIAGAVAAASVFATRSMRPVAGLRWMPHSLTSLSSHHQRPARMSSPGVIARVHGAQPMLVKPWSWSLL